MYLGVPGARLQFGAVAAIFRPCRESVSARIGDVARAGPGSRRHDPVVEVYKRDVDRTLLRENLRLTPEDRIRKLTTFVRTLGALREARKR